MTTRILKISPDDIDIEKIDEACLVLQNGGLVAFPTETVYGLGGDALRKDASEKIYAAKGRPSDNPLIVHIEDLDALRKIVESIPEKAEKLIDRFWPGPMTLVLRKKSGVIPDETTGGLDTVAVRMPSHPVASALIKRSGLAIAAPSANTSGRPSTTRAEHCIEDLDGKVDMIIDSGSKGVIGLESTIIDVTSDTPVLLRPGYITVDMIEETVGNIGVDRIVLAKSTSEIPEDYRPKAPGMKYRHYAPRADFVMYRGSTEKVTSKIREMAHNALTEGRRVGIMCTDETKDRYTDGIVLSVGRKDDLDTIASRIFDVLRQFDDLKTEVIYGETIYEKGLGMAIMNRLTKAAGYKIIDV